MDLKRKEIGLKRSYGSWRRLEMKEKHWKLEIFQKVVVRVSTQVNIKGEKNQMTQSWEAIGIETILVSRNKFG